MNMIEINSGPTETTRAYSSLKASIRKKCDVTVPSFQAAIAHE